MRKICTLILAAVFFLLLLPSAASGEDQVLRTFNGTYQYVLLGQYPYEKDGTVRPVLWRVLEAEDGQALLFSEYVIDLQQVTFISDERAIKNYDYPVLQRYCDSDLCKWMNSEMIGTMFDGDPMLNALLEEGNKGKLFCLTATQLQTERYGFLGATDPSKSRITTPTPYAMTRTLYRNKHLIYTEGGSPYWVDRFPSPHRLQIAGYDGHLSAGAYSRDNIGVRPGVRLNTNLITITGGSGEKKDPFILAYTGEIPDETPAPVSTDEPEMPPEPEEEPESGTEASPEPEEKPDPAPEASPEPEAEAAEEPLPEASPPAGETREEGTALVSFLGDCSIGDSYSTESRKNSYHTVVDNEGYAWPFSLVQQYLGTDDMTVGNLEVVITNRRKHKDIVYPLRADPDHVNILLEGSVDVLNTANNHCYDFYRDGYADTLQALDDAGIDHFGSVNFRRENGFDDVAVKDVNGIRFGFFGLTYPSEPDLKHAEELIRKLRETEHCDYIIASLHWGQETNTTPLNGSVKFAQKLLQLGADMIYGHHPHVLQPIAFYDHKPILFSTGNCTFGMLTSNLDKHAGIFQLTFEKTENGTVLRKLEVIPCKYYRSGDYRIEEETDKTEREKTFRILSPGKKLAGCVNPPDSFLETGIILFDETGDIIAGE